VSRRGFTGADALLLAGLLLANGALWWHFQGSVAAAAVEIVAAGGTRVEALGGPREVEVAGPLGWTRVLIEADGARVLESPCPHKLCVAQGKVRQAGQVVACLPNRVALRVLGGDPDRGVDAVGQ
jgi:hypothetical protein